MHDFLAFAFAVVDGLSGVSFGSTDPSVTLELAEKVDLPLAS